MAHSTVAQLADVGNGRAEGVECGRAIAIGWKLPLLMIRRSAATHERVVVHGRKLGVNGGDEGTQTNSRKAPCTCGATRVDSKGSWTERGGALQDGSCRRAMPGSEQCGLDLARRRASRRTAKRVDDRWVAFARIERQNGDEVGEPPP